MAIPEDEFRVWAEDIKSIVDEHEHGPTSPYRRESVESGYDVGMVPFSPSLQFELDCMAVDATFADSARASKLRRRNQMTTSWLDVLIYLSLGIFVAVLISAWLGI